MVESVAGRDARGGRVFLSAERAFWWAVLRTERDRRLALASRRPITAANLRRLLMRRIAVVDEVSHPFGISSPRRTEGK